MTIDKYGNRITCVTFDDSKLQCNMEGDMDAGLNWVGCKNRVRMVKRTSPT